MLSADTLIHVAGDFRLPLVVDFPLVQVETLSRLAQLPIRKLLLAHGGSFEASAPDGFKDVMLRLGDEAQALAEGKVIGDWKWKLIRPLAYWETDEIRRYRAEVAAR